MNRKRIAAYARVSTNSRTQSHSFEFQSYYWNNKLMNDKNMSISDCSQIKASVVNLLNADLNLWR